jgi:hypothetical protein
MSPPTIKFPDYYDDLAAFEIESKGYLDGVSVVLEDGRTFILSFRDSWNAQLEHDSTAILTGGARVLAVPNLVIVEVVSRANIIAAIAALVRSDFFDRLGETREFREGQAGVVPSSHDQ